MKERLAKQLGPEARQALRLAGRLVGQEPVLKRVASLPHGTRSMLVRPPTELDRYEIHFIKGEERVLDHLVAHEAGHLLRLHQVPEPERLMPAITPVARRRAAEQVIVELAQAVNRGLPDAALPELFTVWHQGVTTQLANFPADLRIEAWIHDRFPALRIVQRRSLLEEVRRAYPSFLPEVMALTPPTIYRATMAMNAAQAYHVAELYQTRSLTEPFRRHGLDRIGKHLAEMVFDRDDRGHRGDVQAVQDWAEELRLTGWFEWLPYTASR